MLDEHFHAADGWDAAVFGQLQERRIHRVINHIKNQAGVQLVRFNGQRLLITRHAAGGCIDEHVEAAFGEELVLERLGLGLTCEFHGGFVGAVDDEDLSALCNEAKDGGPARAARAEDGDARALQL